jgi:hypothetical protein
MRLFSLFFLTIAAFLLLYFIAPQQLPVMLYKATLVVFAALVGYWIDRLIFPYARPDSFLHNDWRLTIRSLKKYGLAGEVDYRIVDGYHLVYAAAMIRRALIMIAVVLGVAQGL